MRPAVPVALILAACLAYPPRSTAAGEHDRITLRGQPQTLHLYGVRGGPAAIVTSGDGGWIHLGPAVAEFLAGRGFFVVGFDAKAYLASFTSGRTTLSVEDVPRDYGALLDYAAQGGSELPLLVGVSVGAGLSVLAAAAPQRQGRIAGVIALGLPERNELGWRLRDSTIYLTKRTPNEPLFLASQTVGRVAPVPLALFRSSHDEFVPAAESDAIFAQARQPCRLWTIPAGDHRFGDNQPELERRLLEAIAWITRSRAGSRRP